MFILQIQQFGKQQQQHQEQCPNQAAGRHVVYFDLYPAPLVDLPPLHHKLLLLLPLPGLPFSASASASTKTRQTFHTYQTWGPTYGVVHNFVYLIFMSCAVAITRQAKLRERERARKGDGEGVHYSPVAASSAVFPAPGIKLSCFSCLIASARLHWPQAAAHLVVAPACAS